jgi:hypothetical protein
MINNISIKNDNSPVKAAIMEKVIVKSPGKHTTEHVIELNNS